MGDQSYTLDEFCEAERICRGTVYKMWKRGEGPAFYYVGNRPRITHEARLEWQRQHAAKSSQNTAAASGRGGKARYARRKSKAAASARLGV